MISWGDLVILPGTDSPTDTPHAGGTRLAPYGYTDHTGQFAETDRVVWDPLSDPRMVPEWSACPGTRMSVGSSLGQRG